MFLAHIGSFVPAEVAHIGIVNRILTRMYSIDSVLDGMSTFAKDLNQVEVHFSSNFERSEELIEGFDSPSTRRRAFVDNYRRVWKRHHDCRLLDYSVSLLDS